MSEQVLYPEEIRETPLPGGEVPLLSSSTGTGSAQTPAKTSDTRLPTKRVAVELLSSSLNTKSKKILGAFDLVDQGAIRIGKYENGVSGEVAITPAGVTAKSTAGTTTFALDGETGDATFAGTIQGGTLIGGVVAVGNGDIVIDGDTRRMIWYNNGIPSIVIGEL